MKKFPIVIISLLMVACNKQAEKKLISDPEKRQFQTDKYQAVDSETIEEDFIILDKSSRKMIKMEKPTLLIIQLDSVEIENAKNIDGEDNFYTAAEDLNWYNSMLYEKYDSLNIPILFSDKDYNEIKTAHLTQTVIKDSTFSLFTYFFYDGTELQREDLMKLISE